MRLQFLLALAIVPVLSCGSEGHRAEDTRSGLTDSAAVSTELSDDVAVLIERADALIRSKSYDAALEYLERGLERVGDQPDLLERLNDLAAYLGQYDLALDAALRLEAAASRVSPWNQLKIAEALLHLGRVEEALPYIQCAVFERGFKRFKVFDGAVYDPLRENDEFQRCVAATHDNVGIGNSLPDLTFRTLQGEELKLRSLTGKVVVVDFWATWCKPCIKELPNLKASYSEYSSSGLEVVGLSLDSDAEVVASYVADKSVPWPVVHLREGWKSQVVTQYGVNALPSTWVYDRQGTLRHYNLRGDELRRAIESLL